MVGLRLIVLILCCWLPLIVRVKTRYTAKVSVVLTVCTLVAWDQRETAGVAGV